MMSTTSLLSISTIQILSLEPTKVHALDNSFGQANKNAFYFCLSTHIQPITLENGPIYVTRCGKLCYATSKWLIIQTPLSYVIL